MTQQNNRWVRIFSDLVGLFDSKPRAEVSVALIGAVIYLFADNRRLAQMRIDDADKWRDREAAIYNKIINRYDPKWNEAKLVIDSTKAKVDSSTERITPVVEKMNKVADKLLKQQ